MATFHGVRSEGEEETESIAREIRNPLLRNYLVSNLGPFGGRSVCWHVIQTLPLAIDVTRMVDRS